MSFAIKNNKKLHIFVKDKIESINYAVSSFFSNITDIFTAPELTENEAEADIVIKTDKFDNIEEFRYEIQDNKIIISGNGDLGVIFGIYSFIENELKIPPYYLFEGYKLIKKESLVLDNKIVQEHPHTRFRGWFVNDEDLLTGWRSLGERRLDYPFYKKVVHPETMEMIAETILRYRMNLIIPATLMDLENPYEKALLEVCSKRGLYVSQHHIEPLGVSQFGFEYFAKNKGFDTAFSYISNKDALEECWKYYVKKWSKYPRVIFQLGLRGGSDRPVWAIEKNLDTPEARGSLIGSAIARQAEIVKSIYPYEINFTSTLWMEGAELLNQGYLHLPDDVTLVFADIGMSQLFGQDFFNIKREKVKNYGIYYHACFWHTGPHLAEGVLPEKMQYCYNLTREYKTDYYSILNVANIKEHTFGIYLNSKLVWQNTLDLDSFFKKYASFYFNDNNSDKLINAIKKYFSSLGDVGEGQYETFCKKYNFSYKKYNDLKFPVVSFNDGMFKAIIYCFTFENREKVKTPQLREVCADNIDSMYEAHNQFLEVSKLIPSEYKEGFDQHWTYQSIFMYRLYSSGIYLYDATVEAVNKNFDKANELYQLSSKELSKVFSDRELYYQNQFKNWFDFETKIDIKFLVERILKDLEIK